MQVQNPFGGPVIWRPETTSTMDDARDWWLGCRAAGRLDQAWGAVLGADLQTRGQGRLAGRRWLAGRGEGLTFTLILPPHPDFPSSLVLGLGLCRWLEQRGLPGAIKWPNDVLVAGRKIAGILVTGTGLGSPGPLAHLCGLGLNVGQTAFDTAAMNRLPTSLALEGLVLDRETVLGELLASLQATWQTGGAAIRQAIEARLWGLGQTVSIQDPMQLADIRTGTIRGLAGDGALLLESDGTVQPIHSGEQA